MEQGVENQVEPRIFSFWVKRLTDQGKLPEDCKNWSAPCGDKIGDIIKKADQIAMKKVNLFDPSASRKPTTRLFEPDPTQAVPGDASTKGSNVRAPDGPQIWTNASLGLHDRPTTISYFGKGWHHHDQIQPMSSGKNN